MPQIHLTMERSFWRSRCSSEAFGPQVSLPMPIWRRSCRLAHMTLGRCVWMGVRAGAFLTSAMRHNNGRQWRCRSRPLRLVCHQGRGRWGSPLVGCRWCRLMRWDGRRWSGRCPSTWDRRTTCSGRGDPWGCYTVCVPTACTWSIGWSCLQRHFCIRRRETSQCLSAHPAQHRRSGTSSSTCSLGGPSSPWLPSMPSACSCTAQASLPWSPGGRRIKVPTGHLYGIRVLAIYPYAASGISVHALDDSDRPFLHANAP